MNPHAGTTADASKNTVDVPKFMDFYERFLSSRYIIQYAETFFVVVRYTGGLCKAAEKRKKEK